MRRPTYPTHPAAPPPPLPPALRTVGQVVGESVKWYRENFWAAIAIGLGAALTGVGAAALHHAAQLIFVLAAGSVLMTLSYIGATLVMKNAEAGPRRIAEALLVGVVVFLPAPLLVQLWVLPAVAWLALAGLVVPVILVERRRPPDALRRALQLARADFLHVVGSLVTLMLLGFLCAWVLYFLLRSQGDAVRAVAAFFTLLVISPILFIGSVVLYDDQVGRAERPLTRADRLRARRDHVATAPREVVATRPGRAPRSAVNRPARARAGRSSPPATSWRGWTS